MDKSAANMYWEEEGVSFYTKYLDNQIDKTLPRYIQEAYKSMTCKLEPQKQFVFMDYGTADGKNVSQVLPLIIEQAREKYGPSREISVILNDVLNNDYKSVWINALELQASMGMFFSTVARSFYNQCAPSNSVHLGLTSIATNWMEPRYSNLLIKDTCFGNSTTDPECKHMVQEISDKEWDDFLIHRSKEMVPGGVLICLNVGNDKNVPTVWQNHYFNPVDKAWNLLYKKGKITKDEKEAALVPMYIRNTAEHKRPFMDPDSAVSKAGLELILFEDLWTTNMHKFKDLYQHTITPENRQETEDAVGDFRAWALKVLFFPHLQCVLDGKRSEEEKAGIMQQMFENTKAALKEDTALLEFPDTLYYHMMVIRKNKL